MTFHTKPKTATSSIFFVCLILGLLVPPAAVAQQLGDWTAVTTKGVSPEARHESAFVRLGDLFYLIGGRGQRTIQVFDPATGSWSNTKTSTNNIHHFQAQAYGDKIYLLGALTQGFPNEDPLANVLIYDPRQDRLLTGPAIPASRRRGSSGIVVYNNNFYIIAGNRNGHSAFLDDGKTPANVSWTDKFDPVSGKWTVLPDAPHARDHFFAEVIGDKIYVAGGRRSRVGTSDGAWKDTERAVDVFDLTTEKWVSGDQLPDLLPTARAGAPTAMINNELLVMGGEVNDNPPANLALAHTEILDPISGKWRRVDDLVLGRHATQAVVYKDQVFLPAGSKTKGGTEIGAKEAFMERFDFGGAGGMGYSDWTTIGNGPVKRSEATSITHQGSYYLFNGFDGKIDIYNRVEKYNPATNTYTSLAPMPTVSGQPTAVTHNGITIVDDVIWIIGGRVGDNPGRVTDAVWLYDISNNTWSKGPTLPARRGGGGVGRLGRTIHYAGGFDENASCDVDDHLMFDLDNPAAGWQDLSDTSPLPLARNHVAGVVLDGKFYIVGGQNGHDGCGGGADLKLVHAYDPVTDEWARLADLPANQSHAEPSTFAYNGKILSVGGAESGGRGVWEFNPAANRWTILTGMELPEALLAPTVRIYQGNMVVLNGGSPNVQNPRSTTRVKKFEPSTTKSLSFNVKSVVRDASGKKPAIVSVILSNLDAETTVPYAIAVDDLPGWLSVDRPTGVARESVAEMNLTMNPTGLTNGSYTHTLVASSSTYQSASLTVELRVENAVAPGNDAVNLWLEAECGTVGANWKTGIGKGSSGGGYVEPLPGKNSTAGPPADISANQVSYLVSVPRGERYRLHARIDAPSGGDDSFWVRLNGGSWVKWWQGLQAPGGFAWREVIGSPFTLPAGQVKIDFAFREDGVRLDKLFLTNQSTLPAGNGNAADNCGVPPPLPPNSFTAIRINAGGPAVTYGGEDFLADTDFIGGKIYTNNSAAVPQLHQSERSSDAPYKYSYRVAVPDGQYTVRLHFAEIYFGANGGGQGGSGKRIFDVKLGSKLVLDNYDISADVGAQKVSIKEFPITVTDGFVDLSLDASPGVGGINQPKLSALEIIGSGVTNPPVGVTDFWVEAECSESGDEWQTQASSGASAGKYVRFSGDGNLPAPSQVNTARQLSYSLTLTEAGKYILFFRMNTPSAGENSFWVSVDGGSWIKFWRDVDGTQLLTQGFEWREVNDDARQLALVLAAGKHTIRVAPRELGTQLDKVYLGKSALAPTGQGEIAKNCGNQQVRSVLDATQQQALLVDETQPEPVLTLYPNPVHSELSFELANTAGGMAEVRISDMNGRLLQRAVYQTSDHSALNSTVDVSDLPAGTYHLRVIGEGGIYVLNQSFIKAR